MLALTAITEKSWQENPHPIKGKMKWCDPIFLSYRVVQLYRENIVAYPRLKILTAIFITASSLLSISYLAPLNLHSFKEVQEIYSDCLKRGEFGAHAALFAEIQVTIQISILMIVCFKGCAWGLTQNSKIDAIKAKWNERFEKYDFKALKETIQKKMPNSKNEISHCISLLLKIKPFYIFPSAEQTQDFALMEQLLIEAIERIAAQEDSSNDRMEHRALFVLSEKGFRTIDFQKITRNFHIRSTPYQTFIDLELAQKGVFSENDLKAKGILPREGENLSSSEILQKLSQLIEKKDELSFEEKCLRLKAMVLAIRHIATIIFSFFLLPSLLFFRLFSFHYLNCGTGFLLGFAGISDQTLPI